MYCLFLSLFSPTFFSYATGKSVETGMSFNETYHEVNSLQTSCFYKWLWTAYSKFDKFLSSKLFIANSSTADEQKERRSSPGSVSMFSMMPPPNFVPTQPALNMATQSSPEVTTTESSNKVIAAGSTAVSPSRCQEIGLVTFMFFFELLFSLCFFAISFYVSLTDLFSIILFLIC